MKFFGGKKESNNDSNVPVLRETNQAIEILEKELKVVYNKSVSKEQNIKNSVFRSKLDYEIKNIYILKINGIKALNVCIKKKSFERKIK
jgi:hypothetical protein